MGQANSIHIQLERDSYWPGETVRGTVHLHLTECLDCDGIKLKAIGETRTKWLESRSTGQSQYVHPFSGKESVLSGESMLAEKGLIQPGMYSYPFDFVLPDILPASFDWKQGSDYKCSLGFSARASTSYIVQAVCMKSATLSRDVKSDPLPFTVLHRNTLTPSGPVTVNDRQDSMICCCFKGGSISGSLNVATDVVEPGSKLPYSAQLTNGSRGDIKFIEMSLRHRVTLFGSTFGNKPEHKQVFIRRFNKEKVALSEDQLKPGSRADEFRGDLGPVPQGLPTTLSKFIKIECYVELLAKMGPLTKSFRLEAPVILSSPGGGPPASPYPYIPPYGNSMEAGQETCPLLSYNYPKLDAPLDWSPLLFKPTSFKLSTGAAVAPTDDDGAEEYFRKSGW